MPREGKQKTIGMGEEEFYYLCQAKKNLEKITHLKMSWGAFLSAIASGALAASAISGLTLKCPYCGHGMGLTIKQFSVELEENEKTK